MDFLIQGRVTQTIEGGVIVEVTADDLHVLAYVVIAAPDISIAEKLIPVEVFESGVQIHVAAVDQSAEVPEQVIEILENMQPDDVVVFLCDGAISYGKTLAVLGIKH